MQYLQKPKKKERKDMKNIVISSVSFWFNKRHFIIIIAASAIVLKLTGNVFSGTKCPHLDRISWFCS